MFKISWPTITVAVISIGIGVLDLVGLLESLPWLNSRIPTITLLVLGAIASYLTFERVNEAAHTEAVVQKGVNTILTSLEGVEVIHLRNLGEYYNFLATSVRGAEHSVVEYTGGFIISSGRTAHEHKELDNYRTAILTACKKGDRLRYREVVTFPAPERFERVKRTLSSNIRNYLVRYYYYDQQKGPPEMQFSIIDSQLLILGTHRGNNLPQEGETYLAIKHPLIVANFADFFDAIWQGGSDPDPVQGIILPEHRSTIPS